MLIEQTYELISEFIIYRKKILQNKLNDLKKQKSKVDNVFAEKLDKPRFSEGMHHDIYNHRNSSMAINKSLNLKDNTLLANLEEPDNNGIEVDGNGNFLREENINQGEEDKSEELLDDQPFKINEGSDVNQINTEDELEEKKI